MNTGKTDHLHIRINKQLKEKMQEISTKKGIPLSQLITSLLTQYIKDNDINNNNEVMVKIPMDKIAHARINLYALEHETTVEDLMLFSTLETIKEDNDVRY